MKSAACCRFFVKFVVSILLIQLLPELCFDKYYLSVDAIFEESHRDMSGKVIRVGFIHVSYSIKSFDLSLIS